ncbi:hypothetical protein FRB99_005262 [Tulasnella sp. 403]|nr:hypothetical protein FRB99_005262 [Tulasnella sp. 403]
MTTKRKLYYVLASDYPYIVTYGLSYALDDDVESIHQEILKRHSESWFDKPQWVLLLKVNEPVKQPSTVLANLWNLTTIMQINWRMDEYLSEESKLVQVIVYYRDPSRKPGLKRALGTVDEDDQTGMLASEKVKESSPAPSSQAQLSNFTRLQEGRTKSQPIMCGRPNGNTGLPIEIYCPVFAQFQKDLDDPAPLDPAYIEPTTKFMDISTTLFTTKSDRQQALWQVLPQLLQTQIVQEVNTYADGVVIHDSPDWSRAFTLVLEIKNEIGEDGSDPFHQGSLSYRRTWRYNPVSVRRSCCPSFILAIAGPWVCISGAILLDCAVVQVLTGYHWVGYGGHSDARVRFVGCLFRALARGIALLKQYYSSLHELNDPQRLSPAIRSFPSTDKPGEIISFTYKKQLLKTKPLFSVETDTDRNNLIVKFAYRYNGVAHKLLEQAQLAPKLLYVDPALDNPTCSPAATGPGPWMVVMERVPGRTLFNAEVPKKDRSRITAAIRQAIDHLHQQGLVFGDLRPPNIVVTETETYLVDFDWCGRHSDARYPEAINMSGEIVWHPDVQPCGYMKKEHDDFILEQLEKYLETLPSPD